LGKRVLICGGEGYIGFPLTKHLLHRGDKIWSVDNLLRERLVKQSGARSRRPADLVKAKTARTSASDEGITSEDVGETDAHKKSGIPPAKNQRQSWVTRPNIMAPE